MSIVFWSSLMTFEVRWREESEVHRNPAARVVLLRLSVGVRQQFGLN